MNLLKTKPDLAVIRAFAVWSGVVLGTVAFFGLAMFGGSAAYARMHENRMYPGVRVLGIRLDGMTKSEARTTVQKAVDEALRNGPRFVFQGQEVNLGHGVSGTTDPDVSRDIISYDIDAAIESAYGIGRGNGLIRDVAEQIDARVGPTNVIPRMTLDEAAITDAITLGFKEKLVPLKNASFTVTLAQGADPFVHIENERSGVSVKIEPALRTVRTQAERLAFVPIQLEEQTARPEVTHAQIDPLVPQIVEIMKRPQLTLTLNGKSHPIPMSTVAGWLTVKMVDGRPVLLYDDALVYETLRSLAPELEQEQQKGSLVIKDGKIDSFVAGKDGVKFDVAKTVAAIQERWPSETTLPIETVVIPAALVGEDPERLGIKEIVGIGRSNFAGSPANRRVNIRKGAEKVNGTIIAPGGEFSLLKTLGDINGANGWLPELVIKGNKTVPEFGGGLCQIGTTTFRGALDSGLKITERRNHSYRVRYYEPAGTDATIYEPAPDFRFMNDTKNHVLINAYLKGDEVIFEFWGTRDGRKVDPIKPRVYNITQPPPTKFIETLDLPPGKKNCTESAHAGADAEFTYHVTYADGTEHNEVFRSHYRAWQAVCLIGVEKLSETSDAPAEVVPITN